MVISLRVTFFDTGRDQGKPPETAGAATRTGMTQSKNPAAHVRGDGEHDQLVT